MKVQRRLMPRWALAVAAVWFGMVAATAHTAPVTIDWVTVGDPNNAADTGSRGAVAASFQIMKYEWTNAQYVQFLNAVDPNGTNPNAVYAEAMGSNARGGNSFDTNASSGAKYAVKTNMGDKPVNYVTWFDAARVANWLQNGQGSGSTETGAYTLNNRTSGNAVAVNAGAQVFIPTLNQWYKAAFYKGGSTSAGYWDYATQSDTTPTAVTASGIGDGSAGSTGNFANYNLSADWNEQDGNVTTVGTNGGPSAYGTFDMNGNLYEWNDRTGTAESFRGVLGGNWSYNATYLPASSNDVRFADTQWDYVGFRLASVAVPEPSTWCLALAGLAAGGLMIRRRRRSRMGAAG